MLAGLQRYQWVVLALAVAFLSTALLLPRVLDQTPSPPLQFQAAPRLADGTPIRVHVSGAVASPGVYQLREGDRVIDAVTLAGGATGGDIEAINLARRLRDGEQVVVPPRATLTTPPLPVAFAGSALLDINTATAAQLDQLPGIGEAYSRRIVDSRLVDGRFQSTEDLVSRRVLPRATYERIRDLISAGP